MNFYVLPKNCCRDRKVVNKSCTLSSHSSSCHYTANRVSADNSRCSSCLTFMFYSLTKGRKTKLQPWGTTCVTIFLYKYYCSWALPEIWYILQLFSSLLPTAPSGNAHLCTYICYYNVQKLGIEKKVNSVSLCYVTFSRSAIEISIIPFWLHWSVIFIL